MPDLTVAADLAKRTIKATYEKAYADMRPIMDEIMSSPRPVELLSQLLPRIHGSSLHVLFLCNLAKVTKLRLEDYTNLYRLMSGQDVAIYDLTCFLANVGGLRGQRLRDIYVDCPHDKWSGETAFFRPLNLEVIESSLHWVEMSGPEGEKRLFNQYFQEYGVAEDEIRAFRKHLLSLS